MTPKQRAVFLESLARGQTIVASVQLAGIKSRQSVYDLRARDQRFAKQWDDAIEEGVEALEQEAWRRGVEGIVKPVFQRGVQVGDVREYSDTLLMALLRARRPGVYRERFKNEHSQREQPRLRLDLPYLPYRPPGSST